MLHTAECWRFDWRRSWDDVWSDEFMREWRRMLERASRSHVYHRPEVIRGWLDTRGARLAAEPHFGLATSSSGAQVFLPWIVVKYRGRLIVRRTLEPAGRELFGYHTPLLAGAEPSAIDWNSFWESARISVGGACDQALFRLVEPELSAGSGLQKGSEESPVLSLDGCAGLDDVLARCSSSHRVDVKRQLRHAREKGELTLWNAGRHDSAAVVRSLRHELWPAYRALWEGRSTRSALLDEGVEEFFERVGGTGVCEGWGHYSVLRIGGTPVAWHIGFFDAGRLYYWVPTHDAAWSNCSPGKLLLAELIAQGCREGWREIHFLTGNHGYKLAWNPAPLSLTAVAWTAPTLRGRVIARYDSHAQPSRN
jgi:CelD/BcsL family acetyltransferase involved in cellulose biosynthesis